MNEAKEDVLYEIHTTLALYPTFYVTAGSLVEATLLAQAIVNRVNPDKGIVSVRVTGMKVLSI